MKNSKIILILALVLCLNQCTVKDTSIQPIERNIGKLNISVDPRMELLATVQLLSNYPMIRRDFPYSKEIMNYFEAFSSHEAVLMTDSLLQKFGFSWDAPVNFMLHLSQPPELKEKIEFSDYVLRRSGRGDNLEQYRKALKNFVEVSNFEVFWNSKIPFYNQILDLMIADLDEMDLVEILENYFNETDESYSVIVSKSFGSGYGAQITDNDGNEIIYANIPNMNGMQLCDFVWHEFGHSFVNPLTKKHLDRVQSLDKLFEPIKEEMTKMAYVRWEDCVNEHIIRAIGVRLIELNFGYQEAKTLLEYELSQHFIYIEPLIEKLKEFEYQRDKYNITFTEFFPQLLGVFESLLSDKTH